MLVVGHSNLAVSGKLNRTAFGKPVAKAEAAKAKTQKKDPPKKPAPEVRALATLCQALISSNAFLYID